MIRAACFIVLVCAAFAAPAQQSDEALRVEILFWETIRASNDPADFRAYLERYPNGNFAALARNRLAALGQKPSSETPQAKPQPPRPVPGSLAAGDRWTYRIVEPRSGAQRGTVDVTVASVAGETVAEDVLIGGGARLRLDHRRANYLMPMGDYTVFSPYFLTFSPVVAFGTFRPDNFDSRTCNAGWSCSLSGRVIGRERIRVPAGEFGAIKVEIYQRWTSPAQTNDRGESVTRTLNVWYAEEAKRMVRLTSRGNPSAWVETEYDLDLVNYQVK